MTYREILTLYKTGKLSEEQKRQVEEELEKQEAISEFLYAQEDIFSEKEENEQETTALERTKQTQRGELAYTDTAFVKAVRASIRRAFLKMGAVVAAVVLVIVLLTQTVLPKLVDRFYFDPTAPVYQGEDDWQNLSVLDAGMEVYSELFLPLRKIDSSYITKLGYGNYNFTLYQSVYPTGTTQPTYGGNIRKGEITFYNPAQVKLPVGNAFEWTTRTLDQTKSLSAQVEEDQVDVDEDGREVTTHFWSGMGGDKAFSREIIEELPSGETYWAYITFDSILPYEDALAYTKEKDWPGCWYGVVTDSEKCDAIGMYGGFTGGCLHAEMKEYPYLFGYKDGNGSWQYDELDTEEKAVQHFTSMLRFLQDQEQFSRMMGVDTLTFNGMQENIDYVEKNGLKVYGVVISADRETMLEILEDDQVFSVGIEAMGR